VETRLVIFLALIVVVSGCADNSQSETDVGAASGKGLEIKSLGVADDTLTPGQQTTLSLTLKNYHTKEIEITELSVFNQGQLEVTKESCSAEQIQSAGQGVAPEMACMWTLKAPSKEALGAFDKPMPLNVKIAYESNIINSEPLKLQFKPLSEIDSAEPIKKTFSNGEVEASMEVENPAPFAGKIIYFTAQNAGPGTVEGNYEFSYTPSSVFEDCVEGHQEKTPVVDSKVEFSCRVQHSSQAIRNLFTSISYKYVKTPTVDIEVVSP
jgi:hypothetical protein